MENLLVGSLIVLLLLGFATADLEIIGDGLSNEINLLTPNATTVSGSSGGGGGNTTQEIKDAVNVSERYIFISNSSDHWADLDSFNSTQITNSDGVLTILESWIKTLMETVGVTLGFNNTFNTTYDNYQTNVSINYTEKTVGEYGDGWSSTYNSTYDDYSTNVSINYTEKTVEGYDDKWSGGAAGNPFDQSLNTTDDVVFNYVNSSANITINQNNAICLNVGCTRYIYDNSTDIVIQG